MFLFLFVKLYKIRPQRTQPQALLFLCMILLLIVLHTSYMIYSLAPQYVMYGSQKYLLQVRCGFVCVAVNPLCRMASGLQDYSCRILSKQGPRRWHKYVMINPLQSKCLKAFQNLLSWLPSKPIKGLPASVMYFFFLLRMSVHSYEVWPDHIKCENLPACSLLWIYTISFYM